MGGEEGERWGFFNRLCEPGTLLRDAQALAADLAAGPTFAQTGVSLVRAHVDNSWVLKPNVAVWYDVLKHVGVGVGAAYLVARPEETITTASGSQSQHLKTDAFELTAGVTFGVWKNKP